MTDLGFRRGSGFDGTSSASGNGQTSGGTPFGARVGRRASAGADLSTLSSSWRASDCMPFGGGSGAAGGRETSPGCGEGAVRMSLEGVSTSDGRCGDWPRETEIFLISKGCVPCCLDVGCTLLLV